MIPLLISLLYPDWIWERDKEQDKECQTETRTGHFAASFVEPEKTMKTTASMKSLLVLVALPLFALTADAQVRNSGFGSRGKIPPYFTQDNVDNYRKAGWKCPDVAEWPQWWGTLFGPAGTVEFPRTGGLLSDGHARLAGNGVYLGGYHGLKLEGDQVYTVWARGKGKLHLIVM